MIQGINKELLEKRRKFRAYYNEKLRGDYAGLEPVRKKYLREFGLRMAAGLVAAGWYGVYCKTRNIPAEIVFSDNAVGVYCLLVSLFWIWVRRPFNKYKQDTKQLVMDKILAFWGGVRYLAKSGSDISSENLRKSGLFGDFDDRDIDDDFKGTYHEAEVMISEQHLTRMVRTRNGSRKSTVFKGIIIKLKFGKKIAGQTVVRRDRGWFNFMMPAPRLGEKKFADGTVVESIFIKSALQNIKLEDPVFEKEWEVYATDQVEARYILTPALMERMLEIKRRFYGKSIEFSFFDNQVLIAVRTNKDMFETTSLFTPALAYHKVQEVVAQFYSVFSAVDLLAGQKYSKTGEE